MSLHTADRPSTTFTWKIEKFSSLKTEKLYSETFYVGGYEWRVLLFPKGNNVDYLSVFLDVADAVNLPDGWSREADFSIKSKDGQPPPSPKGGIQEYREVSTGKCVVIAETQKTHKFNAQEIDWGFASLLSLRELNNPGTGYLVNDTIVIEADVTVHNSQDSKIETQRDIEVPKEESQLAESNSSGNVDVDITGTTTQQPLQPTLGNLMTPSVEATGPKGKVRFLSYWVSSEASVLLERIHSLHKDTFTKFAFESESLPTLLLESFASFVDSLSTTKVNAANAEALQLAAISIKDHEQVGLDLSWLKQKLDKLMRVNEYSELLKSVELCESALNVARAKFHELEEGLAKAKAEVEVMSRELAKPLGADDSVLKGII